MFPGFKSLGIFFFFFSNTYWIVVTPGFWRLFGRRMQFWTPRSPGSAVFPHSATHLRSLKPRPRRPGLSQLPPPFTAFFSHPRSCEIIFGFSECIALTETSSSHQTPVSGSWTAFPVTPSFPSAAFPPPSRASMASPTTARFALPPSVAVLRTAWRGSRLAVPPSVEIVKGVWRLLGAQRADVCRAGLLLLRVACSNWNSFLTWSGNQTMVSLNLPRELNYKGQKKKKNPVKHYFNYLKKPKNWFGKLTIWHMATIPFNLNCFSIKQKLK